MTSPFTHSQLNDLVGIMEKMLIEAQNANWQALDALDVKRRSIIECQEAERSETSVSEGLMKQQLIQRIVALDNDINNIALEAKQELLNQQRSHNDQFKAMQGYARASMDYS